MNAASYLEWSRLSGLYLRNVSHLDRYQTYRPLVSAAGLATIVASEFLESNPGAVNATDWRTHSVYEPGSEAQERVELTAAALDAIGAARVAAAVRSARSNSPFEVLRNMDPKNPKAIIEALKNAGGAPAMLNQLREGAARMAPEMAAKMGLKAAPQQAPAAADGQFEHETREQIETLLARFVSEHQAELQADLARHGDPRTARGYTPKKRLAELEQLRRRQIARESQRDDADKLNQLIEKLRKKVATAKDDPRALLRLDRDRRRLCELVNKHRSHAADDLLPEMREALQAAETFMQSCPQLFAQGVTDDPQLNARFEALGVFEYERSEDECLVQWDEPAGFAGAWGKFTLSLTFPNNDKHAAAKLLDVAERLPPKLAELSKVWNRELIAQFRKFEVRMADWELEDYELDEEQATEASILQHVNQGTIYLKCEEGEVSGQTNYDADWLIDRDHEVEWDVKLLEELVRDEQAPPSDGEGEFDCGAVTFRDSGPRLSKTDLDEFEKRAAIRLPEEYRRFLLKHNGGRPEPGHLSLRLAGENRPADIAYFLPLLAAGQPAGDLGSLESAIAAARQQHVPEGLLPVGRLECLGMQAGNSANLWLATSGKKAGRLGFQDPAVLDPATLAGMFGNHIVSNQASGLTEFFVQSMMPVASDLQALFKKLKARPKVNLPAWLQHIRNDDIAAFLAWLEGGGKLNAKHQMRGTHFPFTVQDYVAREASLELVRELLSRKHLKPNHLLGSWRAYFWQDIDRFRKLMPVLDKHVWPMVLMSREVWEHPDLLEELAAARVDFNASLDNEGATALHRAVQAGNKSAVKWLLEHGADPRKTDKFRRDAFVWAEKGQGFECLRILEGRPESDPNDNVSPDAPGIGMLWEAASQLPRECGLVLRIQIKTPPVTRVEKIYYPEECHYLLSIDLRHNHVACKDMHTPRLDYLHAGDWPSFLFAPSLQWPDLKPLWETLEVLEFDWPTANTKRKYQPKPRPDMLDAARDALEQAFDATEAAARGFRLRK